MRLPRLRSSLPSLIITIFVLGLMLAFIVNLRERARRKAALPAAQAAYQKAMLTRRAAEQASVQLRPWQLRDDAMFKVFQSNIEHARAEERARKAEYDRLRGIRTGFFW